MTRLVLLSLLVVGIANCSQPAKKSMSLSEAINGAHRSEKNKQRDKFRNPSETLQFFDVQPDMTVVEITPGTGWYSEILAAYIDKPVYLAAFDDNSSREYFRKANKKLKSKMAANQNVYGEVVYTTFEAPNKIGPIAPANSADRVLTFRNVHNWIKNGKAEEVFKEFHRVLKDGGILGIVEHRANPKSKQDPKAKSGYVHTEQVIALAKAAGFTFVESSEINANPKDTANHPKGVWTLPPRLILGDKNSAKYMAIGESDRMTLKFRK